MPNKYTKTPFGNFMLQRLQIRVAGAVKVENAALIVFFYGQ